jgi:hypothetical protein
MWAQYNKSDVFSAFVSLFRKRQSLTVNKPPVLAGQYTYLKLHAHMLIYVVGWKFQLCSKGHCRFLNVYTHI